MPNASPAKTPTLRAMEYQRYCACLAVAIALTAAVPATAYAQDDFPGGKPIELTVLFPAGTSADVTARVLAEGMSRQLKSNIVVVNRPGAGGAIGYKYLAAQAPDGHHIVWNSNSISTSYHSGMLVFDYKEFDLVAQVQVETPLLVVKADAPWKGLSDLVASAKANPGKITVGNSGIGSHTHMTSIALFKAVGAEVVDVPFGAAQVIPSLLGAHVQAVVQLPGALVSHVKAGSLRVLAALSAKRDPAFPEVATAREQGINIGAELWRGIAVPKGRQQSEMSADIPVTYVPARNTVFLSYAIAWAEVLEASDVIIGVNAIEPACAQ